MKREDEKCGHKNNGKGKLANGEIEKEKKDKNGYSGLGK